MPAILGFDLLRIEYGIMPSQSGLTGIPVSDSTQEPLMRTLRGADVVLEPQLQTHAPGLFLILNDPILYAYLDEVPPDSEDALCIRLARLEARRSPAGDQQWLNWVVLRADSIAGYVQATINRDHSAHIAYVLGRAFWGKGLAVAACRLMLDELAARYAVTTVHAVAEADNHRSCRLLQRLLFSADRADPVGRPGANSEIRFHRRF